MSISLSVSNPRTVREAPPRLEAWRAAKLSLGEKTTLDVGLKALSTGLSVNENLDRRPPKLKWHWANGEPDKTANIDQQSVLLQYIVATISFGLRSCL